MNTKCNPGNYCHYSDTPLNCIFLKEYKIKPNEALLVYNNSCLNVASVFGILKMVPLTMATKFKKKMLQTLQIFGNKYVKRNVQMRCLTFEFLKRLSFFRQLGNEGAISFCQQLQVYFLFLSVINRVFIIHNIQKTWKYAGCYTVLHSIVILP